MRDEQYLSEIYRSAVNCLDGVENKISWISDQTEQLCLSIIADDLESIVEECETYFHSNNLAYDTASIQSRYETVIEELECLVR